MFDQNCYVTKRHFLMMAASASLDVLLERLNVELDEAPEALLGQGPGGFVRRGSYGGTTRST